MRRLQLQIRLNPAAISKYTTLARAKNQTLATYIREKLEDDLSVAKSLDKFESKLDDLRSGLQETQPQRVGNEPSPSVTDVATNPILTEIVLLLRGVARPEHMNMVHAEMRRQGLDVFSILN